MKTISMNRMHTQRQDRNVRREAAYRLASGKGDAVDIEITLWRRPCRWQMRYLNRSEIRRMKFGATGRSE